MFPLNSWRVIWFCWPAKHPHPTCSHSHSPHSRCNYLEREFPGVPRHHFLLIGCLHHHQLLKLGVSGVHHVEMVKNMWLQASDSLSPHSGFNCLQNLARLLPGGHFLQTKLCLHPPPKNRQWHAVLHGFQFTMGARKVVHFPMFFSITTGIL